MIKMNRNSIFYACLVIIISGFMAIHFSGATTDPGSNSGFKEKKKKRMPEICITMDDVNYLQGPLYSGLERDSMIRATLINTQVKAGMFFIGKYLESEEGKTLMRAWDRDDHLILNHTYSHPHYNDETVSFEDFSQDVLRCDNILKECKNFRKIFRFPYLEEGNTKEKRDAMRAFLKKEKYKNGYVSVMTTDWWINAKMEEEIVNNPQADIIKYKTLYLSNVKDCADFYKSLSEKVEGRPVKHVILLHHNLLNALYLGDLINMLRAHGWKVISAEEAFNDPVYTSYPDFFPSTSSLLTTLSSERNIPWGANVLPENLIYDKEYLKKFGL
jgi:peptidoglycan/xylan/chitin deacetylase (PgdA/CDA1 family)